MVGKMVHDINANNWVGVTIIVVQTISNDSLHEGN